MTLDDLVQYAKERYGLNEEFLWVNFSRFSVIKSPATGQWAALLMRQWDSDSGVMVERVDIRSGCPPLPDRQRPWLCQPVRMHGSHWVGVRPEAVTDPNQVFLMLDRALRPTSGTAEITVGPRTNGPAMSTGSTPISIVQRVKDALTRNAPREIRLMRAMYAALDGSYRERWRNFCAQARFMRDFTDDAPPADPIWTYFPTYHDLSVRQLRAYFTWRTRLRQGDYQVLPGFAPYIYLYELVNDTVTDSPGETLQKLTEFEERYINRGWGDDGMRKKLIQWKADYAVIHKMPQETVLPLMNRCLLDRDEARLVLREAHERTDEEVLDALVMLGGKKLRDSAVLKYGDPRNVRLFADAWRQALTLARPLGRDMYTACFGRKSRTPWHALANAVYLPPEKLTEFRYDVSPMRSFLCEGGVWQMEAYEDMSFDRGLFAGFLHRTDLLLRRYLKCGRYLKDKPGEEWADEAVDAAIRADREAAKLAAMPKITLDRAVLDRIRQDAAVTRDSLLIGDEADGDLPPAETPVAQAVSAQPEPAKETPPVTAAAPLAQIKTAPDQEASAPPPADREHTAPREAVPGLSPAGALIVKALLKGESPDGVLRAHHLTAALAADGINEALFDRFGDTVIECEDDALLIVPDYRDELSDLIGKEQ